MKSTSVSMTLSRILCKIKGMVSVVESQVLNSYQKKRMKEVAWKSTSNNFINSLV